MGVVRVRIHGDGQAVHAAEQLIRAGDGRLKRELFNAIREANVGIEDRIRASALTHLPVHGGLAASVARSRISVRRMVTGGIGLAVKVSHHYDISGMNDGLVIAPNWGNGPRNGWHAQAVRPGWFNDAVDGTEFRTRKFIDRACERFARSL